MFQFQYGTIKSLTKAGVWEQKNRFQFQYGTIKRTSLCNVEEDISRFNSNMVRLKDFFVPKRLLWSQVSIPIWYD